MILITGVQNRCKMMYGEMGDVRDAGDGSRQLDVDGGEEDFTDAPEVGDNANVAAATSQKCDLASKPTAAAAAPLSSRASAFSIAALIKDHDTDTTDRGGTVLRGSQHTSASGDSLYDIAATDHWQQRDREFNDSADVVKTKTDAADYWLTFSNTAQCRM